jgi:hypothetical protein
MAERFLLTAQRLWLNPQQPRHRPDRARNP